MVAKPTTTCLNCGCEPPPGSPLGLCSRCLSARLLDVGSEDDPDAEKLAAAFAKYDLAGEVARGGMGSILRAKDRTLGRTVAMKVMLLKGTASAESRRRFIREALVLARLDHPNIVPIHEMGRDEEDRPFYTMKLVEGETLQAILHRLAGGAPGALREYTLDRLLTIFRKVCEGMAFAHDRGVIHRDLKPDNIMVGRFGEVLVMDWGLAKFVETKETSAAPTGFTDHSTRIIRKYEPKHIRGWSDPEFRLVSTDVTMAGEIVGTPAFMSPEQARGIELDRRSDIFSLGAILYAILTLRPPVEGKDLEEILLNVAQANITPPTRLASIVARPNQGEEPAHVQGSFGTPALRFPHCPNGRVPAALSAVAMQALARKPEDRYQSVEALAGDVEAYQGGFATSAEHAGALGQLWLWMKRHRAVSISAGLILCLSIGFVLKLVASERKANQNARRADQSATQALDQAAKASAARAETQQRAAEMRRALAHAYVTEGWKVFNEGSWFRSLDIFTSALELEADDPQRTAINRMRLGAVLNECPGLLQFFAPGRRITAADYSQQMETNTTRVALAWITTNGTFEAGVWDANTAQVITQPMSPAGRINSIRFDNEGRRVVTASDDKTLRVWDARSGQPLTGPMQHGEGVWEAVFSPDGRSIASVDNHRPGSWGGLSGPEGQAFRKRVGTTALWEAATGKKLWSNQAQGRNGQRLAFSHDGARLLVGNRNFVGGSEETASGESLATFPETWWVNDITHSPAGDRLLVCAMWTREILPGARLLAADTLAPVGEFMPHEGEPSCGAFSPDGRLCVTAGRDRMARIHDAATGRPVTMPLAHHSEVVRLEFSHDGRQLATGCANGEARVWDPLTGLPLTPWLPHDGEILSLQFSRAGNRLFSVSADGVRTWDLRAGSAPRHTLGNPDRNSLYFGFDQSGRHIYAVGRDQVFRIWSVVGGHLAEAPQTVEEGAHLVGYDPEQRLLFRFRFNEGVRAVRLKDGAVVSEPLPPSKRLLSEEARWSGDGQWIAVRSNKGFYVCNPDDGWLRHEIHSTAPGVAVPWAAHENMLAIVTAISEVQILDFTDGRRRATIKHGNKEIRKLGFSTDGRMLFLTGVEEPVRVYDSGTGEPLTPPLLHGGVPAGAAFSPNGKRLATAGADGTVRIWRTSDGAPVSGWFRHRGPVTEVRFNLDGRLLITTSQDGTAIVWDAATGDHVTPPLEHGNRVNTVLVSPDGIHMLTRGGRDATLRLWRLPEDNPRFSVTDWRLACRLFGGAENRPEPGLPEIPSSEQAALWQRLHTEQPQEFQFSEEQFLGWFEKTAWAAWESEDWDKAFRHFGRLLVQAPDAYEYRIMHSMAALRAAATTNTSFIPTNLMRIAVLDTTRVLEQLDAAGPHSELLRRKLLQNRFQARYAQGVLEIAARDFAALHGVPLKPPPGSNFIRLTGWFNEIVPADQSETRGNLAPFFERGYAASGVPFELRALVQLRGSGSSPPLHHLAHATGIPVGRACARLHFLHGHAFNAANRAQVGAYVIHYTGGDSETIPLINGRNIAAWAVNQSSAGQRLAAATEVPLSEPNTFNGRGYRHRLLLFTWKNPRPEQVIEKIDFVSAETPAAPFLVAITAE